MCSSRGRWQCMPRVFHLCYVASYHKLSSSSLVYLWRRRLPTCRRWHNQTGVVLPDAAAGGCWGRRDSKQTVWHTFRGISRTRHELVCMQEPEVETVARYSWNPRWAFVSVPGLSSSSPTATLFLQLRTMQQFRTFIVVSVKAKLPV